MYTTQVLYPHGEPIARGYACKTTMAEMSVYRIVVDFYNRSMENP